MSVHSCVLHEFPRPDREYYAVSRALNPSLTVEDLDMLLE